MMMIMIMTTKKKLRCNQTITHNSGDKDKYKKVYVNNNLQSNLQFSCFALKNIDLYSKNENNDKLVASDLNSWVRWGVAGDDQCF